MSSWLELGPEAVAAVAAPIAVRVPRVQRSAAVLGLGSALPEARLTNAQVAAPLGIDEQWIEKRTGIRERRRMGPGESLLSLSAAAARVALDDAGIDAADVDLVVAATTSPDDLLPNLAPLVAGEIGATRAGGFDVGAACVGFLSALPVAAAQIETGRAKRVLLIAADHMTRWVDYGNRNVAALFGDGAAALVLGVGDHGVGPVVLGADAEEADLVGIPGTGPIAMDGPGTYTAAVRHLADATREAVDLAGLTLDDLDLFVYHQANRRILVALADRLSLPAHKVVDTIGGLGNTSAASVPLALVEARADGRLQAGHKVLLGAVGSGFCWGAGVVTW